MEQAGRKLPRLLESDALLLDQQISELEDAKERLTNAVAKLRASAETLRTDRAGATTHSATYAQSCLVEAATEVRNTLAGAALAMHRAVESTKVITARTPAIGTLQDAEFAKPKALGAEHHNA